METKYAFAEALALLYRMTIKREFGVDAEVTVTK